jgi:hypothetical protein
MAVRAKQATKRAGSAGGAARAKKPALKKGELKKTGGRRKPHTDPLLDGGSVPVMGMQRKRAAKKVAAGPPNKTEVTATRRAKAYSTGIARGGVTGGKGEGKRTHSVGRRGKNPGRG